MRQLTSLLKNCSLGMNLFITSTKTSFKCLLKLTTKESYTLSDGELYQQVDGVAMDSPLRPTLANIFLCQHKDVWLRDYSLECKHFNYKRYLDNIFALFE